MVKFFSHHSYGLSLSIEEEANAFFCFGNWLALSRAGSTDSAAMYVFPFDIVSNQIGWMGLEGIC